MTISGLQIANFQRQIAKDEFLTGGKNAAQTMLREAFGIAVSANLSQSVQGTKWEVAGVVKDKMSDLNSPFDELLAMIKQNEREQKGTSNGS